MKRRDRKCVSRFAEGADLPLAPLSIHKSLVAFLEALLVKPSGVRANHPRVESWHVRLDCYLRLGEHEVLERNRGMPLRP